VALDERPGFVRRVGDVDAEVFELGVLGDELCVGDRLALARASPGGPDVHHHRTAAELRDRQRLAVEPRPLDGRAVGRPGHDGGLRFLRLRHRGRLVLSSSAAACEDERAQRDCDGKRTHALTVAGRTRGSPSRGVRSSDPASDTDRVRRLLLVTCAIALLTGVGAAGAQPNAARSWAAPQIQAVVASGLMGPSVESFRPDDPLTWGEFTTVLASLGVNVWVDDLDRPVTIRELDKQLVTAAGLRPAARQVRAGALAAGLAPKASLGTETVARLLGFRLNHLRDRDRLELQLTEPATRAEVAYSLARLLTLQPAEIDAVRQAAATFSFPELGPWQQTVLQRALRFVGSPYVWAGTSERDQQLGGKLLPGGFDCSGLVWRVYKLEPFAGAPALSTVLKGRTTYAMSGEVPRSKRVPWDALRPADVVFFGSGGPRSKPAEVGHMGIYLGNGWMVHSSDRGTTLVPMTGWYETRFAWGRSPLAEAGLDY
jgi:cell wall-associated NlpC family hydrolase